MIMGNGKKQFYEIKRTLKIEQIPNLCYHKIWAIIFYFNIQNFIMYIIYNNQVNFIKIYNKILECSSYFIKDTSDIKDIYIEYDNFIKSLVNIF